jgi:AP2 domain
MDAHRINASTAPRDSREPGSPDWCYQTMNLMKRAYQSTGSEHRWFEQYLNELREHRAWEKVPIDQPYGSEAAMIEGELGKRKDSIEEELARIKKQKMALRNAAIIRDERSYKEERKRAGEVKMRLNRQARHNSRSGIKGVKQVPSGRWTARFNTRHLGTFDTPEQAKVAYDAAALRACSAVQHPFGPWQHYCCCQAQDE